METILVTGGAGFIGSHFIERMLTAQNQIRIINVDALTYAGNVLHLPVAVRENPRYHFVHADITDRPKMDFLFQSHQIDAVVNFAAESHVDRSIRSASLFLRTNILGVESLMEAAKSSWKDRRDVRFVQISTDEVYGPIYGTDKAKESASLHPGNPYAASKAAADLLTLSYHNTYQFPVIITRCSNNYGLRQHEEKLIPMVMRRLREDKEIPVYGDGLQVRDWIHVSDHCAAIEMVLRAGTVGQVYNIAGNEEMSNMTVINRIALELGVMHPRISFVPDRLGHDQRYAMDDNKIRSELKWSAQLQFAQGIREMKREIG